MRFGTEGMFLLLCGILQLIGDVYLLKCQRYSKHQAIKTGELNAKVLCRIRNLRADARICLNGLQPSGMYCATGICNVLGYNCDGICFSGNDTTDQPEDFDLLCDTKSFKERERLCNYYQQEEINLENHKNSKRQVPSSDELEKQTDTTKEVSSPVEFENRNVTIVEKEPSSDDLEKHTNTTKEVSTTVELDNHNVTIVEKELSSDDLEKHTNTTKEVSSTVELDNRNVTIVKKEPSSDDLEKDTNITKEVTNPVEFENSNVTIVEKELSSDDLEKDTNITKEVTSPVEFENRNVTIVEKELSSDDLEKHTNTTKEVSTTVELDNHNVTIVEKEPSSDDLEKHTNITKEVTSPVEFENHNVTIVKSVQIAKVQPSSGEIDLTEAPPRQIDGFIPKPSILKKYGWVKCESLEFNVQNVCPWLWHMFKNGTEGICSFPCESETVTPKTK